MYKIVCKECGQIFESELLGKEKHKLIWHIKRKHKLTPESYVLNHEHGGIKPRCACGCRHQVTFRHFKFLKFYKDHKNHTKMSEDVKEKMREIYRSRSKVYDFEKLNKSKEDLKKYYDLYGMPDYNQQKISNVSGIDFRTISKYWIFLGIATHDEILELSRKHKFFWSNQGEKNGAYVRIEDDILLDCYSYLKNNPKKITIRKLKSIFNLKQTKLMIYTRLWEKFGKKEIDDLITSGLASKPEMEFGYVLQYYFGVDNVKKQFKIKTKFFDFLLFGKLIVEYDGSYWHSIEKNKANDKEKDLLAVQSGYILFRVKEDDAQKIDTLVKIKEMTDEIQASGSKK